MSRLAICVASMRPNPASPYDRGFEFTTGIHPMNGEPGPGDVPLWTTNASANIPVYTQYNTKEVNLGVVGSYQRLYESTTEELLVYVHDDVMMRERGWDERVLKEFDDPEVGLVGMGGALWHGLKDLYKIPYKLHQLQRGNYLSNVDDAEVHGERFTGERDCAVLDGFVLAVRRSFLDRIGGWSSVGVGCDFFCYDYSICALARRHGYRVRVVGVRCHHRGGGTSVKEKPVNTSMEEYERSHKWFYETFRDVLPVDVRGK